MAIIYLMQRNSLLLFICLYSFVGHAQITGRITDSVTHSVPFCNVLLIKAADSVIVNGTTSDSTGAFALKTTETGDFKLLSYSIGFQKKYATSFNLATAGQVYNAGTIVLKSDAHQLGAVKVSADKPFMEQQIDRTIYNVGSSVVFAGNNAFDILRKLPSVSVDNNDNIKIIGKPGILVMIDGKKTYMSASELAQYLKGLDASQLEKIEVITNPSSKYDAAGSAIINIVLKKDKNLGFNGHVFIGTNQGIYNSSAIGIGGNYRTKKWNFFAGTWGGFDKMSVYENLTKTFEPNLTIPQEVFAANTTTINQGHNYGGRAGIDFTPNDKQTLSFVAMGNVGSYIGTYNDNTNIYHSGTILDSSLNTAGPRNGSFQYFSYDLNYDFKIDTNGKELSASIDYSPYSNTNNENNLSNYYTAEGAYLRPSTLLTDAIPSSAGIWAGQVDYSNPLGKNNRIDVGLKSSFVTTDNNAEYWNVMNGIPIVDTTKTNHFIYNENIYAGYINYFKKLGKKLDLQLGLRGEESQIKGTQTIHDTTFKRTYFNLFPSAFFTYHVNDDNVLNLSYTRRIDRPDYGSLNPFIHFIDPYTYGIGNVNLLPQYTNNFELKYLYQQWFSTGLRYSYYTGVMVPAFRQNDSTHITYETMSNLGYFDEVDLSLAATIPIGTWFTSVTSIDGYYNKYGGATYGTSYVNTGYILIVSSNNSFDFNKGWGGQFSVIYNSRNINGLTVTYPFYQIDAGIRKTIADGRGTISLNCSDIFWSNKTKTSYINNGINLQDLDYYDNRRIHLSVFWKIGQSQYQRESKKKAAAEEENRMQKAGK